MCWQQLLAVVRDMNICASLQKTRGSKLCGRNCVKLLTPIRGAESLLRADLYKEAVTSILGCWVFVVVFNFFNFFFYYDCMFQQTRVSNSELYKAVGFTCAHIVAWLERRTKDAKLAR